MLIVVIEDDYPIANLIKMNLELENFDVKVFSDAESAFDFFSNNEADLILLDIMLPGMNGFELQSRIKKKNIPVIFITAKNDQEDKLMGLKLGADDYITKPFDNRELVLRVKAVLRRSKKKLDNDCLTLGKLKLLKRKHCVLLNGEKLELTPKEFEILYLFMKNYQQVFSREQLINHIWGYDYYGNSRTIDMHIKRLREKLKSYQNIIKTVYGVGYKLDLGKN
ncbi:two-component system, OmpR family, response regulator VicR [Halanaerobium congolense]|jgi:two-component system response regulator VicR|uniref:Stage 0 sporulation protein A homolog n=1 Tax=Halanaerobium congolense TaxID=54121 RepID=A0A1I0AGF9_9FIRM|nr:response regulator transcription factor [Halanaerobium congolense]PTX17414.1 two-component system response regulator VicR [Halanaerobium congolense]TDP26712.1 two-component system response regulator VicR [Halanaerobium congolense]SDF43329.1 two-component system, OmpR family, response regulator VicR [Halanaerobium congolense]SES93275.1 two-component system, OmpR family, response regulator VicR [Halanaerobium congolense]SFP25821.1 two-component system, OmpR family, response regulator VicR [Ha